jgi:hypothetical protein
MENVPAGCRFDAKQCTKHEYCLSFDSQPVVEYPRTPAAAAHGRGMAATLAVIQLDDVTYRGSSDASSHTIAANLVITFAMLVPVSSEAALFACRISELPTGADE